MRQDYEERIKGLNEKINNLQTNLENTKTDLSHMHKFKKTWETDKLVMEKEKDQL
jgi:hypothetical protein